MSRIKLKQILSNLSYDSSSNTLHVSGSDQGYGLVMSGSLLVTSSANVSGSITISGIDTWGDSGSFDTVDLGEY
jgi:hypothetical protein